MQVIHWARQQEGKSIAEIHRSFLQFNWQVAMREQLNGVLRSLRDDVFQKNPFPGTSADGITIYRGESFNLLLTQQRTPRRDRDFFDAQASPQFWKMLGDGNASLSIYHFPQHYKNEKFDPSLSLIPYKDICLRKDDAIYLNPNEEVLRINQCDGPVLLIKVIFPSCIDLVWHFDKNTLCARACSAADLTSSRSVMLLRWLQNLDPGEVSEETFRLIERLSQEGVYYLRWEAIRTMAKLRPAQGMRLLQASLNDPHYEVAEAAQASLALFDQRREA